MPALSIWHVLNAGFRSRLSSQRERGHWFQVACYQATQRVSMVMYQTIWLVSEQVELFHTCQLKKKKKGYQSIKGKIDTYIFYLVFINVYTGLIKLTENLTLSIVRCQQLAVISLHRKGRSPFLRAAYGAPSWASLIHRI